MQIKIIRKYITLILISSAVSFYSCGSDSVCNKIKMGSYSSVPLNELLKSYEVLNIDNKEVKLNINFSIDQSAVVQPVIPPIFINNCSKTSLSGNIYKSDLDYNSPFTLEKQYFKFEKLWLINDEKNIAEISNISFDSQYNGFIILDKIETANNNSIAVMKFEYKNKVYYLKTKININSVV